MHSSLLRVCFLTATPLNVFEGSGTFTAIATLAEGLRRQGADVRFLSPQRQWSPYTLRRFAFNRSLKRGLGLPRPDVIVGFDMDGYRLRTAGIPYVVSVKGVIADELRFETGLVRLSMRWQAACERANIFRARLVVAPSAYSADTIERRYGYPRDKVVIVPEPIDLESWRRSFERCDDRPRPSFTVLTVSRFYRRKNLETLLEAAARIPDIELRVVGDGPERDRLRQRAHQLALDRRLRWLGTIPHQQLAAEYLRCHVFCLPSLQEAFGIVFLEAMAAAKPVVAAHAAAAPEVVRDGITGLLVPPSDPAALAAALTRLRDDPSLRHRLGDCGRIHVQAYDLPKVSAAFLDLIRQLL